MAVDDSTKDKRQRITEVTTPEYSTDVRQASINSTRRPQLIISSEQLFAGANEVQIEHRGALYRLKQTSLGKLILTK